LNYFKELKGIFFKKEPPFEEGISQKKGFNKEWKFLKPSEQGIKGKVLSQELGNQGGLIIRENN